MKTSMDKEALRKNGLCRREGISESEADRKSALVCQRFLGLKEFRLASEVAFYMAKGREVQTLEMIKVALTLKKKVLLPAVINSEEMRMGRIYDVDRDVAVGPWGILEPKEGLMGLSDSLQHGIVVVPGIVFDRNGGRIGFGRGYYDRFLKKNPRKVTSVGLCYSFQVENVLLPLSSNDLRVNIIVTEDSVIRC
ncbi:MAG: 5-formyltetrahydrofolate cyclo-ligase [Nitrospinota bacterium]